MTLDREGLRRLSDAAGRAVTVTVPGEVLTDLDGVPIAVGPSTRTGGTMTRALITRADADRLGWTEWEFPGVRVLEPDGTLFPPSLT